MFTELAAVVRGEQALAAAVTEIRHRSHAFARRQYTWLRRDARLQWLEQDAHAEARATDLVERYLAALEGHPDTALTANR